MTGMGVEDQTSAAHTNSKIWDGLYERGNYLRYPAEVLVKLLLQEKRRREPTGIVLDYGCGSGNGAECMARLGFKVLAVDVSERAVSIVRKRLAEADLREQATELVDPDDPGDVGGFAPYAGVVAWQSLYYDVPAMIKERIACLIRSLRPGGFFIAAVPTVNDDSYKFSTPRGDGSRLIREPRSQAGLIISVPATDGEFRSWCNGLEVEELLTQTIRSRTTVSEYVILYGTRRAGAGAH